MLTRICCLLGLSDCYHFSQTGKAQLDAELPVSWSQRAILQLVSRMPQQHRPPSATCLRLHIGSGNTKIWFGMNTRLTQCYTKLSRDSWGEWDFRPTQRSVQLGGWWYGIWTVSGASWLLSWIYIKNQHYDCFCVNFPQSTYYFRWFFAFTVKLS